MNKLLHVIINEDMDNVYSTGFAEDSINSDYTFKFNKETEVVTVYHKDNPEHALVTDVIPKPHQSMTHLYSPDFSLKITRLGKYASDE